MKRSKNYFSVQLFFRKDNLDIAKLLHKALLGSGGRIAGVDLQSIVTRSINGCFSPERRVTDESLQAVYKECIHGEMATLHATNHPKMLGSHSSRSWIEIALDFASNGRAQNVIEMNLDITDDNYHQEEVHDYMRDLVSECTPYYGCSQGGDDHEQVASAVSLVPSAVEYKLGGTQSLKESVENQLNEMQLRPVLIQEIDRFVPRAYWGNILSLAHVDKLNGVETIGKESGCYLVERWGQNLYLQLTECPWKVDNEQFIKFTEYIKPLLYKVQS